MTDLTISIINYKTKELTAKCLETILDKKWEISYEIWLVDNASSDGSVEYLRKMFPKIKIIESKQNLGFAGGHNLVLKQNKSRHALILNSDTEIQDKALDNLVDFMDRSGFGIGGCKLLNRDGSLQPNVGDLPFGLSLFFWLSGWDDILFFIREKLPSFHRKFASFYQGEKEVGWVSGTALIIKSEVLQKIGLLDDSIFMYGEDTEYCIRAKKAGIKVGWTDSAKIIHLGGGSLVNPSFSQWLGEYKGILYIYGKYQNWVMQQLVRLSIYLFVMIRVVAFLVIGKSQVSKTYVKLIGSI